jgi:6,7-dimethyl-8-ribityllumazine synthase
MTVEASKKLLQNAQKDFGAWKKEIADLRKVGIIYTAWYPEIIEGLRESALAFLNSVELNHSKIDQLKVSGSWELPLAVSSYIAKNSPDFVVVLGCVIKGETPHFDILCNTVASELMRIQVDSKVPLGFGVLTMNSIEQANARMDKGTEAAEAALRSWIQLKGIK